MAVEIIKDFIPGYGLAQAYTMDAEWLTIHGTANKSKGANADMHARYLKNGAGGRGAYWHLTVDDIHAIQHLPFNINGWHAGDGENGTGNRKSIAIEICENADGNFAKAVDNAAYVAAYVLKTQGISIAKMVPHQNWSGKYCPKRIFDEMGFKIFIQKVKNELDKMDNRVTTKPMPKPEPKPSGDSYIGKRVESIYKGKDGLNFYSKATFDKRYSVGVIYEGWGFPTIVDLINVEGASMFKVKNSKNAVYYVTASPKFVKVVGASHPKVSDAKPKEKEQPNSGIKAIGSIEIVGVSTAAIIQDIPDKKKSKDIGTAKKGGVMKIAGSVVGKNNGKHGYWEVIYKGKRAYISGQYGKKI